MTKTLEQLEADEAKAREELDRRAEARRQLEEAQAQERLERLRELDMRRLGEFDEREWAEAKSGALSAVYDAVVTGDENAAYLRFAQIHSQWYARSTEVARIKQRHGIGGPPPIGPGAGIPSLLSVVHGVDVPVGRDVALTHAFARHIEKARQNDLADIEDEYMAIEDDRPIPKVVSFAPPQFDEA